ncbi:hypothetical protein [Nocardioides sp. LS1]|uniref:hypothetical protein n=1 Tax=Nocardioides sp. LS1 TaxID=1027620 RepID=UPI000F6227CC|nr:hypothetical protein [Nocardioides sp. LS1]GCD90348.1 hypothetical protein NLS1_23540 [Nocardioides sp. LS1]
MPIAASSSELLQGIRGTRRAVVDVGHLLRFRSARVRRRRVLVALALVFIGLTSAAAVLPALLPGAGSGRHAQDALVLLPSGFAGFIALAVVAGVASGGGRELLAREHAVIHPVSPTTDHLGALLMAPLNISWLIQAWVLLGGAAYGVGPDPERLAAIQIGVVAWLLAATALGQVAAWALEAMRREPHGVGAVRSLAVVGVVAVVGLQLSGTLTGALDQVPTLTLVVGLLGGFSGQWVQSIAVELALLVASVVVGAVPAHLAARRTPHDEQRLETDAHEARPMPRTPLAGLVRTDRASVWRAVPMRRGLTVLALGPGVIALAGDVPWDIMTILPGLVASGGSLLFGVNAWCLDGRGGLWRESMPVSPATVFDARVVVLAEFLALASAVTLVVSSLRAGQPTASEVVAVLATWVVVLVQVVAAAMRWSQLRPFAVDLRSARATPAPPLIMVGYSVRLAVSTTVTGLVFTALSHAPDPRLPLLSAVPFLCWSLARLTRTRRRWLDPVDRARVVTAVAA